jgi:hypothetical protein
MGVRISVGVLLVILVIYGGVKAIPLLRGPLVRTQTTTTSDGLTLISGAAVHTSTLTLNGAPLLMYEQGKFSRARRLPR